MKEKSGNNQYIIDYAKENYKRIPLNISKVTEKDILEWLEKQPNKQGYIKDLIREDMERKK